VSKIPREDDTTKMASSSLGRMTSHSHLNSASSCGEGSLMLTDSIDVCSVNEVEREEGNILFHALLSVDVKSCGVSDTVMII